MIEDRSRLSDAVRRAMEAGEEHYRERMRFLKEDQEARRVKAAAIRAAYEAEAMEWSEKVLPKIVFMASAEGTSKFELKGTPEVSYYKAELCRRMGLQVDTDQDENFIVTYTVRW